MALTITKATTNADLVSIATLFNTKVNGVSIVDGFVAEWGAFMPMTLAVWQPIMADSANNKIYMGSQPANTLRGAGWWHKEIDGVWMVKVLGIDRTLTPAQVNSGIHDFFAQEAASVPGSTPYGGFAKNGSTIYNYLSSRLPAARATPVSDTITKFVTTATESLALL